MKQQDGSGKNYWQKINSENKAEVASVSRSKEHHANVVHGNAYNFIFDVTPVAGGTFLYMKNLSDDDIIAEGFSIHCPTNEIIQVQLHEIGVPVGGSDIVPANLNAGSNHEAVGIFQTGNDITGLTGGRTVMHYHIKGDDDSSFRNFDADLVIPKNLTMTMSCVNGSINFDGFVVMWHEHDID